MAGGSGVVVRVGVLGPLLVWSGGGQPIEVAGVRLRALLVRLALDAGRAVGVQTLIDDLWGGAPPAEAVNALQSLVSRLRHALQGGAQPRPGGELVVLEPAGYRLAVAPEAVDAHRFEGLVVEGRQALAAGASERAARLLGEALGLWRGSALADVLEAPFAAAPAARLEELRLGAVEDRVEAELRVGRHAEVVAELEALVVAYPLRERLRGLQMRALAGAGRQAEALGVYAATRRALGEELGVDPSPELEAAHLAVLRQDPAVLPDSSAHAEAAAGGGTRRRATNLRARLTSFVGREEDVRRVGKLLAEARLVTLVGAGGSGKTRLAVESAARLAEHLPDGGPDGVPEGVWMVELGGLRDPLEVPQAVLTALGAGTAPASGAGRYELGGAGQAGADLLVEGLAWRDSMRRLVQALMGRRLLVVLDNCEHLLDAAARLVDELLAACPELRVLTTSRQPLGITGETLWAVGPLGLPPEGALLADAVAAPAVRLLADRAAAVRPGFTVTEGNLAAVAEVCRRLDGLPLAIELAVARLRSLPLEQVAARLADRFGLLTTGSRTALPRQRTLRAVLAWSWELLTEPEHILVRRLAAIPGGATLACAEAVCAWDGLPREEVLDLLSALVDKSLLEAAGQAEARYRMLETVRAYAAERLAEAGESAEARARHVRYFLTLAEHAEPRLRSGEQLVWLDRLRAEQGNLAAAVRWAVETGEAVVAVRLVVALGWFWTLTDAHAQAASLLGEVLAMGPDALGEAPPDLLALAHGFHAAHTAVIGGPGSAREPFEAAVRLGREIDRAGSHPMLGLLQGFIDAYRRSLDNGEAGLGELPTEPIEDPDPWVRATIRLGRALRAVNLTGDQDQAEGDFAAALEGFRSVGDRWGMASAASGLADVRGLRGDHPGAVAALEQALGLARELAATGADTVEAHLRISLERARGGDLAGARDGLEQALRAARRQGTALAEAYALGGLAELAALAGDLAEARRGYEQALARLEGGPPGAVATPRLRAWLLIGLGHIAAAGGDLAKAEDRCRQALALGAGIKAMPVAADAIDGLAEAAFGTGDAGRAAILLGMAVAVRGSPNLGRPEVVALTSAVRARLGAGAYAHAYQQGASMPRQAALVAAGHQP